MEHCPRGTLVVMLHHSAAARWDSAKLVSMVRSIARGMLHLHTRKPPMLHRDLKPGNIFVGECRNSLLHVKCCGEYQQATYVPQRPETWQCLCERCNSLKHLATVQSTCVYSLNLTGQAESTHQDTSLLHRTSNQAASVYMSDSLPVVLIQPINHAANCCEVIEVGDEVWRLWDEQTGHHAFFPNKLILTSPHGSQRDRFLICNPTLM